ncbi:hypothetical protein [Asticcacaulis sp. AC402]|uniref:hypothetical protein n=1 Tax=Asticcacaulis sp. AC402 TaxID=1282361 RepID=UPI0003FD1DF6|nr:hypothetical protein [Asticcacaulis sp. AC402]
MSIRFVSQHFAATSVFALMAVVVIAVTAVLIINMPEPSIAAPTIDTETIYVPAADEPAVVDARIEARQEA